MKSLIYSQTSEVQPLKFENGWVISSDTLQGMWLLIHAGIRFNPSDKAALTQLAQNVHLYTEKELSVVDEK